MDMDFKFDEQAIQMSIVGLTGMKTRLQSSVIREKREREREREVACEISLLTTLSPCTANVCATEPSVPMAAFHPRAALHGAQCQRGMLSVSGRAMRGGTQ